MKVQILIESIVQQVTVLIAKLATTGGARAPLAHVAGQIFVDLASELERQGVSRKVTADMFGISLRAYQRKMQRLKESDTERGQTLWEAVLSYLRQSKVVTRDQVMRRFGRDRPESVRSILHDLVESGLVFSTGTSADDIYRAATDEELQAIQRLDHGSGLDELVWSFVFRNGPLDQEKLVELCGTTKEVLDSALARLLADGRVQALERDGREHWFAERLFIGTDEEHGWEAAVYDHFQAVVRTICNRLEPESVREPHQGSIGGSTYTFDVGPGHPLEAEVLGLLAELRNRCHALRERVARHNKEQGRAELGVNVVAYIGQSVLPREGLEP